MSASLNSFTKVSCASKLFGAIMANIYGSLLVLSILSLPSIGSAAVVQLTDFPANWRLENYPGGPVQISRSASLCYAGIMTLPATATANDVNRLWALILAAKLGGHKVTIFYDQIPNCPIVSFGMDE